MKSKLSYDMVPTPNKSAGKAKDDNEKQKNSGINNTNRIEEGVGAAKCNPRTRTAAAAENVDAATVADQETRGVVDWNVLFQHYNGCQQEQPICHRCRAVKRFLVDKNSKFQHYYCCEQRPACQKCQNVTAAINHKRNCYFPDCSKCKCFTEIISYHESTCKVPSCQFCKEWCGNETIAVEFTKVKETSLVGQKFIDGRHYRLGELIAAGGFGAVYAVELLPAGKAMLGIDSDNFYMAAKMANVTNNEEFVLQWLTENNVPHATHYFIVNKRQVKHWKNKKTGKTEPKEFKHLMFMHRAETSLEHRKNQFPGRILPLEEACNYFSQIIQAVRRSHAVGIVHHDIKCGNILLLPDGNKYRACLTDYEFAFHISRILRDARHGGTPLFKPTVVVNGPPDDLHALGILFLEMTIPGAVRHGKGCCPWPEYKAGKIQELKDIHMGIGNLIEACVQDDFRKRPDIWLLEKKFEEYSSGLGRRGPASL